MSFPVQQVISSPYLAGTPTAPTPPAGDSSELVPNTSFVQSAIAAAVLQTNTSKTPSVQNGTGIGQNAFNQVKIGWSGTQLLASVDTTNLGNFLFGSDYTNLVNMINTTASNLQNNINTVNNRPYAFTGIGQAVSFAGVTAAGIQDNGDLNVTGTIVCNNDIWAFASDERLKENIRPIKDALGKLHQITGILYNFNEEGEKLAGLSSKQEHMGVLAQDVKEVAPQTIRPAGFDIDKMTGKSISGENYMTVQYDKLIALVIEAVKELDAKVDALDAKIDSIVGGQ